MLKEIVVSVPEKYTKKKDGPEIPTEYVGDRISDVPHLPIVHQMYLVYVRRNKN